MRNANAGTRPRAILEAIVGMRRGVATTNANWMMKIQMLISSNMTSANADTSTMHTLAVGVPTWKALEATGTRPIVEVIVVRMRGKEDSQRATIHALMSSCVLDLLIVSSGIG